MNDNEAPTIYLRSVMTISTDPNATLRHRDVTAHRTKDGPEFLRWVWHREDKPKRSRKTLTLCGVVYSVKWI